MKTAVIDLDSVCYSIGHPHKVLDEEGNPKRENNKFVYIEKTKEELKESADLVMNSLLTASGATHYIGYMKGEETTSSRKSINPGYKANRTKDAPWWWKLVQQDLFTRWGANYVNDIEVDDAVNITRLKLKDSFICAIDNDLLGLEGTHYNWRKGEWVTVNAPEALRKFWTDMIAGQPGDNVQGLPGKGIKYAEKLFSDPSLLDVEVFTYPQVVFKAYIVNLGVEAGIKEYYKNYMSLKILDSNFEHFTPITPIEYHQKQTENLFT